MYYHGFNLTLCNAHNDALPVCVNNVTENSQVRSEGKAAYISSSCSVHAFLAFCVSHSCLSVCL